MSLRKKQVGFCATPVLPKGNTEISHFHCKVATKIVKNTRMNLQTYFFTGKTTAAPLTSTLPGDLVRHISASKSEKFLSSESAECISC
jgi:hypothetical protein